MFQACYNRSGQSLLLPSPGGVVSIHCPILPGQAPSSGASYIRPGIPLALLCGHECFGGTILTVDLVDLVQF